MLMHGKLVTFRYQVPCDWVQTLNCHWDKKPQNHCNHLYMLLQDGPSILASINHADMYLHCLLMQVMGWHSCAKRSNGVSCCWCEVFLWMHPALASRCSPHDWAFLECWLHCSCVWLMIMWPQVWILPPLLLIPVVFLVHLVNLKSCVSALPSTVVQTTWLCTPPIWYSWLPQWHSNTPSCLYSHDYVMDTIQKFLIFSFNYKMRLLTIYTS